MTGVSPATRYADLGHFAFESGARIEVRVAYRTWGTLSAAADNAVVVCHALTGSADADAWWAGLFGPGRAIDPDRDFVVCSNILGGCYGTTGPWSVDPATGRPYGPDFPQPTVRDIVSVQAALVRSLGVRRVRLALGGSLGGMQALEWPLVAPDLVEAVAPIAVSGRHSAWCIGLSEAQRQAIFADPAWQGGRYEAGAGPRSGLAVARMMAMCTYRSPEDFAPKFGRRLQEPGAPGFYAVESYLRHQGRKLVDRFDANTYVVLTRAMDSHDVGRGRGGYEDVLRSIRVPALVVSIRSDVLYPPAEQEELATLVPRGELFRLDSPHGHDAFLIDTDALSEGIVRFRKRVEEG